MLTIEKRGNEVFKYSNGRRVDDSGDFLEELNYYLNNGYKLLAIEGGVYHLEVDDTQLMFVEYISAVTSYRQVMTCADASLFRLYYNAELTCISKYDEEVTLDLSEGMLYIQDLRGLSPSSIAVFKARCLYNEVDILETILEDLSYA